MTLAEFGWILFSRIFVSLPISMYWMPGCPSLPQRWTAEVHRAMKWPWSWSAVGKRHGIDGKMGKLLDQWSLGMWKGICRWKLVLRCYSCGTSMNNTLTCCHAVNVGPFLQLHTNSHAIQSTSPYHLSRLPSHHQSLSHLIHLSSNFSSHIILSPVWYMLLSQKISIVFPFPNLKILEIHINFPKTFRPWTVEVGWL